MLFFFRINGQQVQIANMINENGETVQVIVQPEDGQFVVAGGQEGVAGVAAAAGGAGEQAAIMVGPDGSIVNTNNQVTHFTVQMVFKMYTSPLGYPSSNAFQI